MRVSRQRVNCKTTLRSPGGSVGATATVTVTVAGLLVNFRGISIAEPTGNARTGAACRLRRFLFGTGLGQAQLEPTEASVLAMLLPADCTR